MIDQGTELTIQVNRSDGVELEICWLPNNIRELLYHRQPVLEAEAPLQSSATRAFHPLHQHKRRADHVVAAEVDEIGLWHQDRCVFPHIFDGRKLALRLQEVLLFAREATNTSPLISEVQHANFVVGSAFHGRDVDVRTMQAR